MKHYYLTFFALLMACQHDPKKNSQIKSGEDVHPANLLKADAITKRVINNHKKLIRIKGNFDSFKEYISGLDNYDLSSIPYALDYIKTCLPVNLEKKDSVLLLFNLKFYKVTNVLNDSLETRYAGVIKQIDDQPKSPKSVIFGNNLKACGIGIFSTEGNYYLDVLPDYFYDNFSVRVSAGVKQYLFIRKSELAEGFTEDAGLLISFESLYNRVKRWEKFLNNYPNTVYDGPANGYYTTYLETLLTGTDNSRVFDDEKNILLPEVKSIYEKALADGHDSKTAKIITDYYSFLSRHAFKENDSIPAFLSKYKLSTMLAVQTDNR